MLFEASVCRDKHGRCYGEQEESPKQVPHVLVVVVVTAPPADLTFLVFDVSRFPLLPVTVLSYANTSEQDRFLL